MHTDTLIPDLLRDTFLPAYLLLRGDRHSHLTYAPGWALLSSGNSRWLPGRQHEAFVYGAGLEEVLRASLELQPPFWLTGFGLNQELRSMLEHENFNRLAHEYLMLADLTETTAGVRPAHHVQRIQTEAEAEEINQALGFEFAPREKIYEPALTYVWIEKDGQPAAYGRAATVRNDVVLDHIGTRPPFRGQGLARSIMQSVIKTAVAEDVHRSVLISTEMGRALYTSLGFETLVEVDVLTQSGREARSRTA